MLTYHALDTSPTARWLGILNSNRVRKHLLQHPQFSEESLARWLRSKIEEDEMSGCRIRAVHLNGELAGWCGIQRESGNHEIAIVLAPEYWGHGREVMSQVMRWAQELGHRQLLAHLPQTRPQRRALARFFGQPIAVSTIKGEVFDTYRIEI